MDDLETQAIEMMNKNNHTSSDHEPEEAVIKRLASFTPINYDRARKEEAEKLGISVSTLDKAVNATKRNEIDDSGFPNVDHWEHPISPAELLNDISTTVHRFIVCNQETADAVALWASMTWFMDVVQIAPLAIITAPEKRCGKTQLLTILGKLSYRPVSASILVQRHCIAALKLGSLLYCWMKQTHL